MKFIIILVVIIALAAGAGFVFQLIRGSGTSPTPTPTESPVETSGTTIFPISTSTSKPTATPKTSVTPTPSQIIGTIHNIKIQSFAFSPLILTVKRGETVVWTNKDPAPHDVTSDTDAFVSSTLSTGDTFSFTFNTTGTFNYHCSFHPNMRGQIIVQ